MAELSRRTQKRTASPSAKSGGPTVRAGKSASSASSEHAPQQRRSAQTRERIIESVAALLEADAYSAATVQDIVSAAGCSVGAFYGRFKDKDAALFAIYEARCTALEEGAATILQAKRGSLEHKLRKFIELVVEHTLRHKTVIRAGLIAPSASNITPFTQRAQVMNAYLIEMMGALLRSHKNKITHKQPDHAALYVVAIIGGLTRDGLASNVQLAECKDSVGAFVKEIEKMVYGYLGLKKR
jgi:AcrR family transcriptional regulator